MRAERQGQHISGAETLCLPSEISKVVNEFTIRALCHPKGQPHKVTITIEKIHTEVIKLKALPVYTAKTHTITQAWAFAKQLLLKAGVSEEAFSVAKAVIESEQTMRGATVVTNLNGKRLEPDPQRGLRATRLGIDSEVRDKLFTILKEKGLNIQVVTEALVLATKVAYAPGTVAELCVSDDPDYTTGYVANRRLGYIRIPNLKEKGSHWGGRAFFVYEDVDLEQLKQYLEKTPVLISQIGRVHDEMAPEDILSLLDC